MKVQGFAEGDGSVVKVLAQISENLLSFHRSQCSFRQVVELFPASVSQTSVYTLHPLESRE